MTTKQAIDYDGLPGGLEGGARRWIENGIQPGGFLSAVICNDLTEAAIWADDRNSQLLALIVKWWYTEAHAACWGSPAKARTWAARFKRGFAWSGAGTPQSLEE